MKRYLFHFAATLLIGVTLGCSTDITSDSPEPDFEQTAAETTDVIVDADRKSADVDVSAGDVNVQVDEGGVKVDIGDE